MENVYRGVQRLIVETDDYENISQVVLNDLEVGDMLIIGDGEEKVQAILNSKNDNDMCFVNVDSAYVNEIHYAKNEDNKWEFDEIITTEIDEGGKTTLYSHHFDLIFENDPNFGTFGVEVNAISSNPTPYEKLSDLEGDGYIMSAFGSVGTSVFVDLRLVHEGTCYMYMTQISDGTMSAYYVANMGDFELEDSVQKI